jgi:hypothetical protein
VIQPVFTLESFEPVDFLPDLGERVIL